MFMCNNRILYVNIQAPLWRVPAMKHSRLGRRVLIPRNGLHNRINVGHGRLEVPRASHSAYKNEEPLHVPLNDAAISARHTLASPLRMNGAPHGDIADLLGTRVWR